MEEPMSINLIVFCGIPASGKTTLSKQLTKQYNANRYSFDEMGCLRHKELIPHILHSLIEGNNTIVDSTYTLRRARTDLLEAIKDINCKKTLISMSTPLDECIRRNKQRKYPVPQHLIETISSSMQPPSIDEGWDEILYF
jgi:tRNA uridine 5-carbamoylmethylation protein Kti12